MARKERALNGSNEDLEDPLTEEDMVSPHVRPWLEKRLDTKLSPFVWQMVNRYVLLDYQGQIDPVAWPKEEQATFVEEVQAIQGAQMKDLRRAYRQGGKRAAPQTGEPATSEISEGDMLELLGSTPNRRVTAAEARAASVVETGDLRAFLRSDELACATAIASYFGAFITLSPVVQRFRRDVLGNRLLSDKQADDWILSPLSRFLNREDMAPFVRHMVQFGALPDAQVISWEQGDINGRQAQKRAHDPGVIFERPPVFLVTSEWNKYPFRLYTVKLHVKENRGGDSSDTEDDKHGDPEKPMLLTRTLMTHLEELLWAPFLPSDYDRAQKEETFPHVFPRSVADELGRIARGFAQVLPFEGEQIARFLLTGKTMEYTPVKITVRLPCRAVASQMPAVVITSSPSAAIAQEEEKVHRDRRPQQRRQPYHSKLTEVLVRRLQQPAIAASLAIPPLHSNISPDIGSRGLTGLTVPNCVRGYIRLEAEPWVSAETIEVYWRHFQEKSLKEQVNANTSSSRAGTTLRVRKPRVHRTHRVTSVQAAELVSFAMQANIAALVKASLTSSGKSKLPSLSSLHQQLNRADSADSAATAATAVTQHPVSPDASQVLNALHGYSDPSVLIRVYRQACHALDLPDDIGDLAEKLWKKQNNNNRLR